MRGLLVALLLILCATGVAVSDAQLPGQVELSCPNGTSLMSQSVNPTTGKYRQWACNDNAGNVLFQGKRYVAIGTPLTASNIAFSAGFGTSPVVNSITGTDTGFFFKFTAGSGSTSSNPNIVVTFADGPYPNRIVYVCFGFVDSNGVTVAVSNVSNQITTSSTFLWIFTPTASVAYDVECVGVPQ